MNMKNAVIGYLKDEPKFRERKNKDRGIVNLLMRRYAPIRVAIETGVISKDLLTDIVKDHASMDCAWRQALEHDPSLRGSDYDEKDRLEQEAEIALVYTPGYSNDIKKLKTL